MPLHQRVSARASKRVAWCVGVAVSCAFIGFVALAASRVAAQTQAKLEATVFTYDGHDFVRTKTTLATKDGKSAVDTKLEHDTPAYKALIQKRSYSGEATAFGRKYDANYAPLTSEDGRLTGALFVGVPK